MLLSSTIVPVPVIDSAASSLRSCEPFDTVIVPLLASVVLSERKSLLTSSLVPDASVTELKNWLTPCALMTLVASAVDRAADDAGVVGEIDRRAAAGADDAGTVVVLAAFELHEATIYRANRAVVEQTRGAVGTDPAAGANAVAVTGRVDVDAGAGVGRDQVVVDDDRLVQADLARTTDHLPRT